MIFGKGLKLRGIEIVYPKKLHFFWAKNYEFTEKSTRKGISQAYIKDDST